jgi:hypothetical protein
MRRSFARHNAIQITTKPSTRPILNPEHRIDVLYTPCCDAPFDGLYGGKRAAMWCRL